MFSPKDQGWSRRGGHKVLKDFSFVLPTRGDPVWVNKLLRSLERTTARKDRIEVLFAIDEGKTAIIDVVRKEKYSFDIHFFERPRTEDFTNTYYNWLADRAIGGNIWAFNDDAWIRTEGWDRKILKHIDESGWSIYMVDVLDTARIRYKNRFPCFPLVSRRAFCLLGWLLYPPIKMYPADQWTHEIYYQSRRIIRVPDVVVEHEHIDEHDETKKNMLEAFKKQFSTQQNIDFSNEIYTLLKASATDFVRKKSKFRKIIEVIHDR